MLSDDEMKQTIAGSRLIGNPWGLGAILKVFGFVCRTLVASGVPDFVKKYADATENKLDDIAANVVVTLIKKGSEL